MTQVYKYYAYLYSKWTVVVLVPCPVSVVSADGSFLLSIFFSFVEYSPRVDSGLDPRAVIGCD